LHLPRFGLKKQNRRYDAWARLAARAGLPLAK
jgi:hypothetical protein